jgi:hypothetical protein
VPARGLLHDLYTTNSHLCTFSPALPGRTRRCVDRATRLPPLLLLPILLLLLALPLPLPLLLLPPQDPTPCLLLLLHQVPLLLPLLPGDPTPCLPLRPPQAPLPPANPTTCCLPPSPPLPPSLLPPQVDLSSKTCLPVTATATAGGPAG